MTTNMQFTSDGITYRGFQAITQYRVITKGDTLIVAWFDGEPDLWITDCGTEGLGQLRIYYRAEREASMDMRFDVWSNHRLVTMRDNLRRPSNDQE